MMIYSLTYLNKTINYDSVQNQMHFVPCIIVLRVLLNSSLRPKDKELLTEQCSEDYQLSVITVQYLIFIRIYVDYYLHYLFLMISY